MAPARTVPHHATTASAEIFNEYCHSVSGLHTQINEGVRDPVPGLRNLASGEPGTADIEVFAVCVLCESSLQEASKGPFFDIAGPGGVCHGVLSLPSSYSNHFECDCSGRRRCRVIRPGCLCL